MNGETGEPPGLNKFIPCDNCPNPELAKQLAKGRTAEKTIERLNRRVAVAGLVERYPEPMRWAVESTMVSAGELVCTANHPSNFSFRGCPIISKLEVADN